MSKSKAPKKKAAKPDPFKNKGEHPLKAGKKPKEKTGQLQDALKSDNWEGAEQFEARKQELKRQLALNIPAGFTLRDRFLAHYHRDGFEMMKGEAGRYWHLQTLQLAQEGIHLNENGTFTVDPVDQSTSADGPLTLSDVNPDFTHKERLFILHYVTNGRNRTKAALEAGYSPHTAYAIGAENLRKPKIKAEVERLISERLMPKDEVLQRLSQMARANLNDYLTVVKRSIRPMVKASLSVIIAEIRAKIEDQAKFITRAKITDKKRLERFAENVITWEEEIIRLEIELERNPDAYEERPGEEVTEEVVELDVVKLMQDKERGLIKSLKRNRNGEIEVELYGADGALRDIGRYHGIFEKDNKRFNINTEPLTAEDAKKISKALDEEY